MIALDPNGLVRYLVRDDAGQAEVARSLLGTLSPDQPGYVRREVILTLVWVLERAAGLGRGEVSAVLEQLVVTGGLWSNRQTTSRGQQATIAWEAPSSRIG